MTRNTRALGSKWMRSAALAACIGILLATLPAGAAEALAGGAPDAENPPLKVLFIGNSMTFFNDLPKMVHDMAESAPVGRPRIEVGRVLAGGKGLRYFWEGGTGEGTARAAIASGKWDYVVLQDIARPAPEQIETDITLFHKAIRSAGSKMLIFAHAPVSEAHNPRYTYPDYLKNCNDIQIEIAKKTKVAVAAGGYAWMKYLGPNPTVEQQLDLYNEDKQHPGPKGTYIYACVIYAILTGENPAGLRHDFEKLRGWRTAAIPEDEALRMQKAAWEQYLENKLPTAEAEGPENAK